MQVAKWGNSLAVRLPAKLVAELGLAEGDEIEVVRASPERLEIERKIAQGGSDREAAQASREICRQPPRRISRSNGSDAYDED